MHVRATMFFASLGCAACEAPAPNEGPFLETRYVRYVSDQPFAPCGGLARETDKQVEFLFDLLGEPYPPPLLVEYEWVEDNSMLTCGENAAGCAQATAEGGAAIASIYLAYLHELAHAAHLLTIGTSHRVLTEGFATYASDSNRVAAPQDTGLFTQAIESFLDAGPLSADQYPLAARFVGMTIERHGIATFKEFWKMVPRAAKLAEVRAAYEANFGESWSDALATIASREQTVFRDPYCEGDAQAVGNELKLTLTQTCEDEDVTGPLHNSGVVTGELPIPIELASEGMYRFRFNSAGGPTEPVASLRGCSIGVPAPVPSVSLFTSQDDVTQYLGPGRYLLNVRVSLAPGDNAPIDVTIERI
jgi:hypothetical protein